MNFITLHFLDVSSGRQINEITSIFVPRVGEKMLFNKQQEIWTVTDVIYLDDEYKETTAIFNVRIWCEKLKIPVTI